MAHKTGISDLPHSQGQVFFTLDEYLAHLIEMGKQDRPFYELVEPECYRLNVGRGRKFSEPQYFTRKELLEKYGFNE